jgi:hypothetical protein
MAEMGFGGRVSLSLSVRALGREGGVLCWGPGIGRKGFGDGKLEELSSTEKFERWVKGVLRIGRLPLGRAPLLGTP